MKKVFVIVICMLIIFFTFSSIALALDDRRSNIYYYDNPIISTNSIVVDSEGNIYLENGRQIQVYDINGEFSHSIKINTNGSFMLNMDKKDHLYVALAREDKVLIYNQQGHIIEEISDENAKFYREYEKRHSQFRTSDGSIYSITRFSDILRYQKLMVRIL